MPTPPKRLENSTKHWTNAEKERREAAEKGLTRDRVRLIMPRRVKDDQVACAYWKATLQRMKGLELLDNVDSELLAGYCIACAQVEEMRAEYREMRSMTTETIKKTLNKVMEGYYMDDDYPARVIRACVADELAMLKTIQGQERLVIGYAKELGLTPNSRQRLAKRKAEEMPLDEADELYG